ncbi:TRAP transporter substrate-binding protein DctP [Fulvivirga ligni]|uniref:TRAP transporter substrate-binding protein DctP n=1 Tax=Fulvivirga ligni TaxID=2904246 RepID=UPI001F412B99|nr:TRAP transporter substrate-binding protein DctP [Fulvivirga ligni]UII19164.1 TRAP transporter substrate-binding protein DctP [Fulvivirga ligni]
MNIIRNLCMNGITMSFSKASLIILFIMTLPFSLAAQKTLVYSDHQPLEGMRTKFLNEVFFPAIERESGGRLKIEAHWDGELAIAYKALGAVSDGSVDISTVVPEYTAKELPLHQIFKSFPVGPSGADQVAMFRKIYEEVPQFTEEFNQNNIVPIFLGTGYPVGFFSREPMENLDQLAGNKWRSASFWHLAFLENLGAVPVRMHWGNEIYEALKNKELDGIMVNVDSGYDLKVYEHAPYILASKDLWLGHLYPVAINKNTWEALDKQDQEAIQRAAVYAYKSLGKVMDKSFKAQMKTLKQEGATVRYLTKKEVEAFKVKTKYMQEQDRWAKEQQEAVPNVIEVMQAVRKIIGE